MARETIVRLIDDIDGTPADETVTFGIDGQTYEIDLCTRNAARLRDELALFANRGVRVPKSPSKWVPKYKAKVDAKNMAVKQRNREIRAWAAANGIYVHSRGSLKTEVVEAYNSAHREL